MDPFTWRPYAIDQKRDYSNETPTLVEFKVESTESGTLLTLTEAGFENVAEDRREEAFKKNAQGWETQMKNIETYLAQNPWVERSKPDFSF